MGRRLKVPVPMRPRILLALAAVIAALALAGPASALTNPQIAGLQVALRAWGLYVGQIDGIAGPQTSRAVRIFQRRHDLRVDGVAGPQTRRALGRVGGPLFGRRTLVRGRHGWDVAVLQFLLRRRGASPGIIDGYFGPETQHALRRFQHRVRAHTLRALGAPRFAPHSHNPRPSHGRGVRSTINHWASHYSVSSKLARALAWMESGFQPEARSSAGAWGVMQITPPTWAYVQNILLGVRVPRTTSGNIRVGVAYLHHLLHEFGGRTRLALAAYYAGPAAIRRWGIGRQSRPFVRNVLALVGRV